MIYKISVLSIFIHICFSLTQLIAQEVIVPVGGDISGSGGNISFTIGQVAYTTNTGTNVYIAEGVQQPYEISVLTQLEEIGEDNILISVFPNPTTDYLTLTINSSATNYTQSLKYQLYNLKGKVLQSKKFNDMETIIPMNNLAPSTYFLRISDATKEIKIIKIIKN